MTHSEEKAYFFKIDTTIKRIRLCMQKKLQESGLDITVDQWVLIDHLYPQQGITQNDLAALTAKDAPTVTRILDLLVKKGYVTRKASKVDRRKFHISLTPEGENMYTLALPVVQSVRRDSWHGLSDTDYDELVRIMEKVYDNINGML